MLRSARRCTSRQCSLLTVQLSFRARCRFQSTEASFNNIPPALFARARNVASEHKTLSSKLANGFDKQTARKLSEYSPVVNALQQWDIANDTVAELTSLLQDASSDTELRDLAAEDIDASREQLDQASRSLIASLVPVHPFAHLPCLLEIRPGVGGLEAGLFAGELVSMYQAFCNRTGLRCTLLKYENTNGTQESGLPLTEAILDVEQDNAYGVFRCESGVHRVQRVPATDAKGRMHTSAAAVRVMPRLPDNSNAEDFNDPESDYYIDLKEVKVEVMRASGAGGQHVNKTESAVRLTHIPSQTVVSMQDSRSQTKNKEKAWTLLRSRIAQMRREKREEEMAAMRRSIIGVAKTGRGDKVRTYHYSQQRVTDHRSGTTVHDLGDVMAGGETLDKVMDSVRGWLLERDVEVLIAEEDAQ